MTNPNLDPTEPSSTVSSDVDAAEALAGPADVLDIAPQSIDGPVEPDAEDEMMQTWADDADALGTEVGGFGPDRPRDAAMPGLYSLDEIDDRRGDAEVVSEEFDNHSTPERP